MSEKRNSKSTRVQSVMIYRGGIESSDIFTVGTMFFFCLTYILLGLTDGILVSQGVLASNVLVRLKYPCMLATIAFGVMHIVLTKHVSVFYREFSMLLSVGVVFSFISAIEVIYTDSIGTSTIDDLMKLVLPALMAYCVLNTLSFEQLQKCMVVVLFSSVVGYLCELSFGDISLMDIWQSDFSSSSSPLESSIFAGMSITLCFYYCYYRSDKFLVVLSVLYAIATFKRLAIIFAVIMLFLPLLVNVNRRIHGYWIWLFELVTLILTFIYYIIIQPSQSALFERIFKQNQMDFTMGRSAFLTKLSRNDFMPFGYGSSADVIGRTLEMDLIQIAVELSPIALLIFVHVYWNICGRNLYCILIMTYEYINFLTSHSLNSGYKWGISFILIGMINYMPRNNSADMGWFAMQVKQLGRRIC